jgi:DNA-binding MarR family transcriptional regulator
VDKSILPLNLTVGEFRVLRVLSESGPAAMVRLAKEQTITQAAMTSIVDHLEELKLIDRLGDETDRRVTKVTITQKGREEVKMGLRLYRKFIDKASRNLTPNEKRGLLTILDHMLEAAERA